MGEIQPILSFSRSRIHLLQPAFKQSDSLWNPLLIRVILVGHFEDGLEEQRVSTEPRRRLGQEPVQLDLSRLWLPFDLVHKLDKLGVLRLFPLKLELAVRLVGSVLDERLKKRDVLKENVTDRFDDRLGPLSFVERVRKGGVVGQDEGHVPEHLGHKRISSLGRLNDLQCP